ncbi:MAG: succinylglutamate desuccinylase/aspartoacylase family protein [Thermomicrobiales bacterium]|nr:succinylglutamate desuccinylase/aspartoacylase family protein [Thermomicrobiales bacterium]
MSLRIGDRVLNPGEKHEARISLGSRPDGTPLSMPVMGIAGARPGPVLGLVTGIHGDEYEGPEAVREILQSIQPDELSGGIIATPIANVPAYEVFGRAAPVDGLDLNRQFPGNAAGFLSPRIAETLVREVVEQSNALIDLHSAGLAYDLLPYTGFNDSPTDAGKASLDMAKAFGIPILYGSTPFANVLRLEAVKREIPVILVEVGGEARLRPDGVATMVRGIRNVLSQLGMIDEPQEGLPAEYTIVKAPPGGEFSHVDTGGFIRNHTSLGAMVDAGQVLGTIVDVFGHEITTLTAPITGMVLSYRTVPVVRTGEWGYSVVEITGTSAVSDTARS